jgi:hypothetical protein
MDRTRLPNRQSIRLPEFDYSQNGAYFVTVCTTRRLCLLGNIEDGEVRLSPAGQIARLRWQDLPRHTLGLTIDVWVVVPNHTKTTSVAAENAMVSVGISVLARLVPIGTAVPADIRATQASPLRKCAGNGSRHQRLLGRILVAINCDPWRTRRHGGDVASGEHDVVDDAVTLLD